jgi:CBS domain-containing protein
MKQFVFFSEVFGRTVLDSGDRRIARLIDLKVRLGEPFPQVTSIVLRTSRRGRAIDLAWEETEGLNEGPIRLKPGAEDRIKVFEVESADLLLRADLLDKQVVDTSGAKVERVNDIHLLVVDHELRLVHIDFGARGLLRRLGWLRPVDSVTRWLFAYSLPEKLISWKYIQPLAADPKNRLKLNVTQRKLQEMHPSELADILEELDRAHRSSIFHSLDLETAAETFQEVDPKIQLSLIEMTSEERASDILEQMEPDEAKDFLAELPEEKKQQLIRRLDRSLRQDVEELLRYKDGTAGSIMTKDFLALPREATIALAIEAFKKVVHPLESIAYIYVTGEAGRLLGVITLRHLVICDKQRTLESLMNPHVISVGIEDDLDKVADLFNKYKFLALPVVDPDSVIQGIITLQDIVENRAEEL